MSAWENFRVEATIGYGPDDPNALWTDLTPYVDNITPISIQTGRPTEQTISEPSAVAITFNNTDHRFTFGNTSSPLYPSWRQSLKMRVYDVVGFKRFPYITGWMEEPAIDDWTVAGVDQQITVTLVDRLVRVDRARTFISTLAEYVLYNGGSSLQAYYPCNEASGLPRDVVGRGVGTQVFQNGVGATSFSVTSGAPLVLLGQGSPVFFDDGATLNLQAGFGVDGSGNNVFAQVPDLRIQPIGGGLGLNIPAGQVVTVVLWINGSPPQQPYDLTTFGLVASCSNVSIRADFNPEGNIVLAMSGALTASGTIGQFPISGWTPLAIRYGWSPPTMETWIGANRYVSTVSGSPPASDQLVSLALPQLQANMGHLQIYVGTPTAWDLPQLIAQSDAAKSCLAGQYTGQRIATLARYAGVASSELSNVDNGTSMMGRAALAGSSPYAQMQIAETTEQGRLYANGNGLIVFQDRVRRYTR